MKVVRQKRTSVVDQETAKISSEEPLEKNSKGRREDLHRNFPGGFFSLASLHDIFISLLVVKPR